MDILSIEKFKLFISENKTKILEHKVYHPIDEENFNKWIELHREGGSDLENLAIDFRRYTKHVSYTEFLEKIGQLCADIRKLKNDKGYSSIILLITNNMFSSSTIFSRSNFWVSLIFYIYLQDIITDVFLDIPKSFDRENVLIIVPDDASYSGDQYSQYIYDNFTHKNLKGDKDIFIAIPYVSNKAYTRMINTINNIKSENSSIQISFIFSENTIRFYSFYENLINNSNDPYQTQKIWRENADCLDKHTIYFDHKLADTVSIYQYIYALGRPLNSSLCDKNYFQNTLIKNCNYSFANIPCKQPIHRSKDLQEEPGIGAENMCPSPFYKFINYTFNGQTLKNIKQLF